MTRTDQCFCDSMRPITPAETDAWKLYLTLHRDAWRPARIMFRSVCSQTTSPAEAVLAFAVASGVTDAATIASFEAVLERLAREARQ